MNKILKMGIALSAVICLFGCSSSDDDKEVEKKDYKVGETATFEDVEYTITKVEKSAGESFDTPADGKEFVIVHIKIENKSDDKISYNVFDYKMLNSKGQEDTTAFTTVNNDTNLSSGDLVAGGVKEGTLAFEQDKDDELKLNYYGSVFEDEPSITFIIK